MLTNNVVVLSDDSSGDRYLFKKSLTSIIGEQRPIEFVEACSGQQVMNTLVRMRDTQKYPTLLILDFILGDTNGLNIAREIKGNFPPFPIVVMSGGSGCGDFDEVADLYRAGVSAFVYKPTTMEGYIDLMTAIKLIWLDQPKPNWDRVEDNNKLTLFRRRSSDIKG